MDEMTKTRDEFKVHLLNPTGIAKATELSDIFSDALTRIESLVPAGRERALVVTKLQEACFFAKRGIALDSANTSPTPITPDDNVKFPK